MGSEATEGLECVLEMFLLSLVGGLKALNYTIQLFFVAENIFERGQGIRRLNEKQSAVNYNLTVFRGLA